MKKIKETKVTTDGLEKNNSKKVVKKQRGITLIALVVTIIALLILAGVAINLTIGENGIFTRAQEAAIVTAVASVKEEIELEKGGKLIGNETLTPEDMVSEGKANRMVQEGDDGAYQMYYALKEGAYKGMQNFGKGEISSLKDVFLIDDNLNVKYISSDGKEYGDELEEKVLNDDTEITFANKEFEEYVKKVSGVTDGKLRFQWMKNLTSLNIEDESIDSLEDLVFFPNLTSLSLGYWSSGCPVNTTMNGIENCKKLTELTVYYGVDNKDYSALSSLTNLKKFTRTGGTDYENIVESLKNCPTLESLNITYPRKDVDIQIISKLTNLTSLYINATANLSIKNLEYIKNMNNLTSLSLLNGKIEKIEGLENLTNLKTLDLSNNLISDITPLKYNTNLTSLNLRGNSQIDGDRSNYTGEKLDAINEIGKILDRNGTINIDKDKLGLFTNYKNLDLRSQNLENLSCLKGMTQLESLILYDNNLTLEDSESVEILKSMTNLKTLNLRNNKNIEDISFVNNLQNLTNLNIYECTKIRLKQIQNKISSLSIAMSTETFKTLEECDVGSLTILNLQGSGYELDLNEFPIYKCFSNLKELYLPSESGILDFSNISQITTLEKLDLKYCELNSKEKIDFSKLSNLKELTLSNNYINTEYLEYIVEKLKNNTNLTMLDLRNNSINDPTSLLKLSSNVRIYLGGNVNISQEAKNQLTEHFGKNVSF